MKKIYIIFLLINISTLVSAAPKIKYQTLFASCPSRVAGKLTLKLIKEFEKRESLRDVKKKIIKEKLAEKSFLSKYSIKFNPLIKVLQFSYECPTPLMKVQIYPPDGGNPYDAILVEKGKLVDPTYEVLLRKEQKLNYQLPHLSFSVNDINKALHLVIADLVIDFKSSFKKKLSELIINENQELIIIISVGGKPSSAFLGSKNWKEKAVKLQKIVSFMEKKKKVPAVINLTNAKKVVVKFTDKI